MRSRCPEELVEIINGNTNEWEFEACRDLCDWAGLLEEWDEAGGDEFEGIVYEAARRLGLQLD